MGVAEVAKCVGRQDVDTHNVCQKVETATRTRVRLVIAPCTAILYLGSALNGV